MLHDLSRQLRQLLNEGACSKAGRRHPADTGGNIIRLRAPTLTARDRTSQNWRQRLLTKQGAWMYAASVDKGDRCSIAILDTRGMVVAWHDTLPGAKAFDLRVAGAHVSQFYLPHDVTFGRPHSGLVAACLHGSDTQQRWHRRPGGTIFWAVTIIQAMRLKSGELNGYSHVTRYAQDPRERIVADARRAPRLDPVCYGAMAVA
ncbi:MAG TPA: hypothetical protein VGD45_11895 [Steroidobacter sp.]|uniref:hypothetical protein n=1 Tax=Steroidobacter sp. TaxID=1978227 RepID=UPI002ED9F746